MSRRGFERPLRALVLLGALCSISAAQGNEPDRSTAACFEIVVPQHNVPPARPLLVNKCTGATWLLVGQYAARAGGGRSGRLVYRWISLKADGPPPVENREQPVAPSAAVAAPSVPAGPGQKCFEFTGRRFCE